MAKIWTKNSYTAFKTSMEYFSHNQPVFKHLSVLPPVVSPQKIQQLRRQLQQCERNHKILLHVGDCAQPFQDITHDILKKKMFFFSNLREKIFTLSGKSPVLIGRIAGQYAKPRSSEFVIVNGKKIHNYKGDNINDLNDINNRDPQSSKLLEGYQNSVITYNFIQNQMPSLYTSHEGLILPYEAALTRQFQNKHYCLSAHMIWIGQRTRQIDGAHVEFFRGISNPIGIKISSNISEQLLYNLVRTLNPENEEGKLLVIIRMGKKGITEKLNQLVKCKVKQKLNFLFVTDPMHGNTFTSQYQHQLKLRDVSHMLDEISKKFVTIDFFSKCIKQESLPFGFSLQATYDDVTECFGLSYPLTQAEIMKEKFKSKCDPRLNQQQTISLLESIKNLL